MFKRKRIFALVLALLMLTVFIAGCNSGGNDTSPSTGGGTTPTPTPTPAPTPEGADNILRFGTTGIDGAFNPIMSSNVYDAYVCDLLFEGLITNDHKGAFSGYIADYTISDDFLTYTFTLKDGIKFSDGTPMTSADVAFTYKTMAHPDYNGPRSYAVADMLGYEAYSSGDADDFEGIKVIDGKTVSFTFAEGMASPANIECFSYGIMPEHYYKFDNFDDFLDLNEVPVGSGWFVLDEYRRMEYVMLSRNDAYWDAANAAKIDGVLMSEIPDESLMDSFATGLLDLAQPGSSQDAFDAYTAMDNVTIKAQLGNGYTFMCFNTKRPQLEDVRVRQALMYALDRVSFIAAQYGPDLASVGLAPISPVSWAFPDSGINDYAFDMAKAAALMDEAGWTKGSDGIREKGGVKMAVNWLVYTDSAWPGLLSSMAADTWKELGVDLTIELMDFVTVASRTMDAPVEDKDFDIYTMGFSLSIDPDPTGALFDYDAYVEGGFNASGYYNEKAQQLIKDGKTEFDQAKRAAIYKEWAQLMNQEIPTVIIAYRYELWVHNDRVQNLDISPYVNWTYHINKITLS